MKQVYFWLIFSVLAVWGQYFVPSMDFFTPGLVVLLQLGHVSMAMWLGFFWMMVQEGAGGLAFGAMILFYSGMIVFFYIGGVFFEVSNFLFTFLIFVFLVFFMRVVVSVLASLQGAVLPDNFLIHDILVQTGLYFLVWIVTFNLFKKHCIHEPVQR
ncbi:MAG: hypothetical protein D5R98_10590 [Desulfonatronovibrio sp. MSAO_Bac4]|nr:MAG: hypothetical protein D5R98_10590 [Desulfonatronovibrio sp. MSAO_Bac4]